MGVASIQLHLFVGDLGQGDRCLAVTYVVD